MFEKLKLFWRQNTKDLTAIFLLLVMMVTLIFHPADDIANWLSTSVMRSSDDVDAELLIDNRVYKDLFERHIELDNMKGLKKLDDNVYFYDAGQPDKYTKDFEVLAAQIHVLDDDRQVLKLDFSSDLAASTVFFENFAARVIEREIVEVKVYEESEPEEEEPIEDEEMDKVDAEEGEVEKDVVDEKSEEKVEGKVDEEEVVEEALIEDEISEEVEEEIEGEVEDAEAAEPEEAVLSDVNDEIDEGAEEKDDVEDDTEEEVEDVEEVEEAKVENDEEEVNEEPLEEVDEEVEPEPEPEPESELVEEEDELESEEIEEVEEVEEAEEAEEEEANEETTEETDVVEVEEAAVALFASEEEPEGEPEEESVEVLEEEEEVEEDFVEEEAAEVENEEVEEVEEPVEEEEELESEEVEEAEETIEEMGTEEPEESMPEEESVEEDEVEEGLEEEELMEEIELPEEEEDVEEIDEEVLEEETEVEEKSEDEEELEEDEDGKEEKLLRNADGDKTLLDGDSLENNSLKDDPEEAEQEEFDEELDEKLEEKPEEKRFKLVKKVEEEKVVTKSPEYIIVFGAELVAVFDMEEDDIFDVVSINKLQPEANYGMKKNFDVYGEDMIELEIDSVVEENFYRVERTEEEKEEEKERLEVKEEVLSLRKDFVRDNYISGSYKRDFKKLHTAVYYVGAGEFDNSALEMKDVKQGRFEVVSRATYFMEEEKTSFVSLIFSDDLDYADFSKNSFIVKDYGGNQIEPEAILVFDREVLIIFKSRTKVNAQFLGFDGVKRHLDEDELKAREKEQKKSEDEDKKKFSRQDKKESSKKAETELVEEVLEEDVLDGYLSLDENPDRYVELTSVVANKYETYVDDDIVFKASKLSFGTSHNQIDDDSTIAVEMGDTSHVDGECAILVFGNDLQHAYTKDAIPAEGLSLLSQSSGDLPIDNKVVDKFVKEKEKPFLGFVYFEDLEVVDGESVLYMNLETPKGLDRGRYRTVMSFELVCPSGK